MSLINLGYTEEEKKEQNGTMMAEAPKYPYGLSISFDPDTVKKLGLNEAPEVGDKVKILADGIIKDVSLESSNQDDTKSYSFTIQLTDVDFKGGEEKEGKEDSTESVLYGGGVS